MLGRWVPTTHKEKSNLNISIMSLTYALGENLHLSTDSVYTRYLRQGKSQTPETSCSACKNWE